MAKTVSMQSTLKKNRDYKKNIRESMPENIRKVIDGNDSIYKCQSEIQSKGIWIDGDWKKKSDDVKWKPPEWKTHQMMVTGNEEYTLVLKVLTLKLLIDRMKYGNSSRYHTQSYGTARGVTFKPDEMKMHTLFKFENGVWEKGYLLRRKEARQ